MIIKQINRDAYISNTKKKKKINFHGYLVTYILISGSLASNLGYTCERHNRMSRRLQVGLWDNAHIFKSWKIFEHVFLENMVACMYGIMLTFLCHVRFLSIFSWKIWLYRFCNPWDIRWCCSECNQGCLLMIHWSIYVTKYYRDVYISSHKKKNQFP